MKKISKPMSRIISLLMAVVMVFGMLPVSAFAATDNVTYTAVTSLSAGDECVIVGNENGNYYALANNESKKIPVTVSDNTVTLSEDAASAALWTVNEATESFVDGGSLTISNNGYYLGRATSSVSLSNSINQDDQRKYAFDFVENLLTNTSAKSGTTNYFSLQFKDGTFTYEYQDNT